MMAAMVALRRFMAVGGGCIFGLFLGAVLPAVTTLHAPITQFMGECGAMGLGVGLIAAALIRTS
jgi:hypothetical protein